MKDKRSEFRCSGCINNTTTIEQPCPSIAYHNLCGTNQLVAYHLCYKSSEKKFAVTNSCNLCKYYEKFNCASGFCRHPSFKVEYIGSGYWDEGKTLTKWNSLFIQFPERIHKDCPLPELSE